MITVEYDDNSIEIKGHACSDRNENNHDLVCCAVSTLIQSLGMYLEGQEDKLAYLTCSFDEEENSYYIETETLDNEFKVGFKMLFEMVIEALKELATEYPKNIRIV